MKRNKLTKVVLSAMFAAMIYAATAIIQIPISVTGGYVNLGDCIIILCSFLLSPPYAAAAGGLGSALADILSGYTHYALGTFVIKFLMAFVCSATFHSVKIKAKFLNLISAIVPEIIMIIGYFIYESLCLGYGLSALAAIPGNLIQGVVAIICSILIYRVLKKSPQIKKISETR